MASVAVLRDALCLAPLDEQDVGAAALASPKRPPGIVSLARLGAESFRGVPPECGLRGVCWRVLLGALPENRLAWEHKLSEDRRNYADFVRMFVSQRMLPPPEDVEPDNTTYTQICVDIDRTHVDVAFFQPQDGVRPHDAALVRILWVFACLNPGIGYVQGMNELLALMMLVLAQDASTAARGLEDVCRLDQVEADSFALFAAAMAEMRDHYCAELDSSESGVVFKLMRQNDRLHWCDSRIWHHLQALKIDPRFYAFRWLTLLYTQDFSLADSARIWDSILGDGQRFNYALCFGVAMLVCMRDQLLAADFAGSLEVLQRYPNTVALPELLACAEAIYEHRYSAPDSLLSRFDGPLYVQKSNGMWSLVWCVVASTASDDHPSLCFYADRSCVHLHQSLDITNGFVESVSERERNMSRLGRQAFRVVLAAGAGAVVLSPGGEDVNLRIEWMANFARFFERLSHARRDDSDFPEPFDMAAWMRAYCIAAPDDDAELYGIASEQLRAMHGGSRARGGTGTSALEAWRSSASGASGSGPLAVAASDGAGGAEGALAGSADDVLAGSAEGAGIPTVEELSQDAYAARALEAGALLACAVSASVGGTGVISEALDAVAHAAASEALTLETAAEAATAPFTESQ